MKVREFIRELGGGKKIVATFEKGLAAEIQNEKLTIEQAAEKKSIFNQLIKKSTQND